MFHTYRKKEFVDNEVIYKDDCDSDPELDDDVLFNLMNKFQFDNIINIRTTQLSEGGFPYVKEFKDASGKTHLTTEYKAKSNIELRWIAIEELKQGLIPFRVPVEYPNGKTVYIRVCDMDLTAVEKLMKL